MRPEPLARLERLERLARLARLERLVRLENLEQLDEALELLGKHYLLFSDNKPEDRELTVTAEPNGPVASILVRYRS